MKLRSYRSIAFGAESGAEMAELAVIMPLLFMVLFGIMWFGRGFQVYSTVNQAARAGAEAAALPSCPTSQCGNTFPNSTQTYIQNSVVNPILLAAHLDPTQVQAFSLQFQPLNAGSPENVAIVSFTYPFSFKLNGVTCCPPAIVPITNGITFTAWAQAPEEQ